MDKLKPCPCGETPAELRVDEDRVKYTYISGDCCNYWSVEVRIDYWHYNSAEFNRRIINAWNAAPRKADTITTGEPTPLHDSADTPSL